MSNTTNIQVMLITGTSRGIGEYLAKYYLSKGYTVVGCSRTSGHSIQHSSYHHIIADISIESEIHSVINFIRKEFKCLSVLINNAGINPAIVSAALLPYASIEQAFRVNVFAPMMLTRETIKLMTRSKFGRIINIGSMASKHEVAGEALYTSTKSAMIGYTRVVAKEVYKHGITVNMVAPSAIETELSKQINKAALAEVLSRNAIHSLGDFSDVSNIIDLLINKESHAITGQILYLGGV